MKQKVGRKIVALFTMCCILLMGMPVFAAEQVQITADNLVEGVLDLSTGNWENKEIVIPSTILDITIKGTSTDIRGLTIKVEARSIDLNLTINNLNISGTGSKIDISANTAVTNLKIEGDNTLNSSDGNGISVYTGNTLVVGGNGTLNIQAGDGAAGIGGRYYTGAGAVKIGNGNIKINSGTLNIKGGNNAAAIGSSNSEDGSDTLGYIIINGGTINAIGGSGGAAIGSGAKRNLPASSITINGGIINAVGGTGGAGIGSGWQSAKENPYIIKITGGAITAVGNDGGAGIGGGKNADTGDITISGGKITKAEGSGTAAGIGGGHEKSIDHIIINGSAHIVEAIGGNEGDKGGAGIGGSGSGYLKTIIIGGNAIIGKTIGGKNAAGIGGGAERGFHSITVEGNAKIVDVKGGENAAAIGTGGIGYNGTEKIYLKGGEVVEAQGGKNGAGIGAGNQRGFELIEIDGTVIGKVVGGNNAAGIGTGPEGAGTNNKIIIKSELYVDADKRVNAIGGGEARLDFGEVTIDSVIMMGNNTIKKVTTESALHYANVAFCCLNVDGTTAQNIKFDLYNKSEPNKSPNPETNNDGIIFSWVPIGVKNGDKLAQYGYYFRIEDEVTKKVFYAKESGRSEYEHTDPDGTKRTIPLIYVQFAETVFDKTTATPIPINGSKIIPYSLSTICCEFKLPKPVHDAVYNTAIANYQAAHTAETVVTDTIKDNTITLKLLPDATDPTSFDLADVVNLVVYTVSETGATKKYTYDKTLTQEINKEDVSIGNKVYVEANNALKTIKINIPAAMRKFDQGYRIDVICKSTLNEEINTYITGHVEGVGADKIKVVEMVNEYNIETVTPWDDSLLTQLYPINETSNLNVAYEYLTKIS